MVVPESGINNIMGGLESAEGVRLHNHRRKLRQRFDIVRKLGQGTYGKVQLGINKETGQEVAIKIIKKCKIKTEADLIRIRREIQIMSSVRHPNIIHIYEVFENQDKMVLVMEYAAGGELYEYLNERNVLTEEEARRIFRQISTAIYYCHKHKICHRDLKLENILLDEHGSAKIADFGLSNVFCESRLLTTFCGSPLYASPEIVKGIPYHGPEVDCWSLGVLLYILVYKAMPFDGSNFKRLVRQISQGDYFEPKNSSPASPLIRSMLNVNPSHRADIISICSHWWVDQTYSESCLEIAEDLANQTPVRLDLLLSLVPSVSSDKLVIGDIQVDPQSSEKPVRSQSLDSIAPLRINSSLALINSPPIDPPATPAVDKNASGGEKKKVKTKSKRERSSSRTRKKESSTSIDSDADGMKPKKKTVKKEEKRVCETEEIEPQILENDAENIEKLKENIQRINDSLQSSKVIEVPEDPEKYSLDVKEAPPQSECGPEKKEPKQEPLLEKSDNDQNVEKSKSSERRRSKVFETAEKFSALNNSSSNVSNKPAKKIFLPGVKVGDAKREYERKSSLVESSSNLARASPSRRSLSGKSKSPSPAASPEKKYSLASTINLNKLAESALKKSSEEVTPSSSADVSRTSSMSVANEVPASAAVSNKRPSEQVKEKTPEVFTKKSSEKVVSKKPAEAVSKESSESSLSKSSSVTTTSATDSDPAHQAKVKNAVKVISHAISADGENKSATIPRRKTSRAEIVLAPPTRSIPVKVPEYKSEVEHFINEPHAPLKSQVTIPIAAPTLPKPVSRAPTKEHIIPIQFEKEVSKTPTPPSSLHSLSKQSTFDSDSQLSMSSSGDPIRKSAREVIIPIAVEGGGYVTPASDNMSRISSFDETEEERPRGFTLHSTRRRHPHSDRIESTDSISSDEDDDNFEILTAENLFSTLLNRVRSLTHKLSTEDGAHHSYPRSFFTQHQSIFDNLPSRRLAGTRSFARSDSAPWRRRPVSSIPSDVPEIYSAKRLSMDTERPLRFDEKPPPYQSRSSYSGCRPSYLRSLSNSLSSSNAFTNQYPWKYKTDEQETNSVNNGNRDSFRKDMHRHSFHGTLDYSKYNGDFNPDSLKLDDLNLPMIPELGNTSKSDSVSNKYSSSRWSNRVSDTCSNQLDSRCSSESKDDDSTPVASPDPKSRQSPSSYSAEPSRVSRIPTFQRSNSVNREMGTRRLYQRSYSVTPERSVSSSRFLSNGPTSRASTPEPSVYPQRYSRFLPPPSIRSTPDRKLSEDSQSSDKTTRYRRYGVSLRTAPVLPPSSVRVNSRGLTHSNSSSNSVVPEKEDKVSLKSSSSRLSLRSLAPSNSSTNFVDTDKDDKTSLKSSSSRHSLCSLSYSGSSSNCVNNDKEDKAFVKSNSSRFSSRTLAHSGSSSNCVNPAKEDGNSTKPSSNRRNSHNLLYSSSSNNCINSEKEDKACIKSGASRRSSRSLIYSSSSSNCINPDEENEGHTKSSSDRRNSRGLTYSGSLSNCHNLDKDEKASLKSSSSRFNAYRLTSSSSSSNCTNQKENKTSTKSSSCVLKSRGLSYSNSSSNCTNPDKDTKSLIKSSSMNKVSSLSQNRRNLHKTSSNATSTFKRKSNDEFLKTRKVGPYSRSLTETVGPAAKSDAIKRRSSFTSDNRNFLEAAREKVIGDPIIMSKNTQAPASAFTSARKNRVKNESTGVIPPPKLYPVSKEKCCSNQQTNDLKTEKTILNNIDNAPADSFFKQSTTTANVSEISDSCNRTCFVRDEYNQQKEVTEGSITNQSSFSDFDESCTSSWRASATSTVNDVTEIKAESNSRRNNKSLIASRDEFMNQQEDLGNQKNKVQKQGDRPTNQNDLMNSSRNEPLQFASPKSSTKTTFKPQTVSSSLKSKFEVYPVTDSGSDNNSSSVGKLSKQSRTLPDKKDIKDIIGETTRMTHKLRQFSEVFPGRSCDSGTNEDNSTRKRTHCFLETKMNKNGKPILNYEFHRRLTSPSYQEESGGNWIQDSNTSRFLNSYLRRSPSRARQTEEKSQENGVTATPMKSSSGVLMRRSASSSSVKRDPGGSKSSPKRDLHLGIPRIMYNSEISSYDETSSIISPTEDGSDTWSASSDYADAFEYLPPSGRSLSCPTGAESVSDRIRRKSYYTRFNPSVSGRRFLSSTLNFTNTMRPGSRLPSYSRSFSTDMTRSLHKF